MSQLPASAHELSLIFKPRRSDHVSNNNASRIAFKKTSVLQPAARDSTVM